MAAWSRSWRGKVRGRQEMGLALKGELPVQFHAA